MKRRASPLRVRAKCGAARTRRGKPDRVHPRRRTRRHARVDDRAARSHRRLHPRQERRQSRRRRLRGVVPDVTEETQVFRRQVTVRRVSHAGRDEDQRRVNPGEERPETKNVRRELGDVFLAHLVPRFHRRLFNHNLRFVASRPPSVARSDGRSDFPSPRARRLARARRSRARRAPSASRAREVFAVASIASRARRATSIAPATRARSMSRDAFAPSLASRVAHLFFLRRHRRASCGVDRGPFATASSRVTYQVRDFVRDFVLSNGASYCLRIRL